jgi:CHAT domain-containing protein/tetratricopeptide (TPR) repeat protein
MTRPLLLILLFTVIVFCFAQDEAKQDRDAERRLFGAAEVLLNYADRRAEKAGDNEKEKQEADNAYRKALQTFETLISGTRSSGNDSVLVLSELKAGLIHYYLGETGEAKKYYFDAFQLRDRAHLADSSFFMHYVFTGAIYHAENEYDSALHFYNLARDVQGKYDRPLPGSKRLYNHLGEILYENGNLRQARNYFEKAIELTGNSNPDLVTNYRIKIASILVKLDDLEAARKIYEAELSPGLYANEINHNLAIIYLRSARPGDAIQRLRSVSYGENRKIIDLYYNFAQAYDALGEKDSAAYYYQSAVAENTRRNGSRKNVPFGLLLKFRAEQLVAEGQVQEALSLYQQSILQFHSGFTETEIRENPHHFGEAFSYINLLHALTGKAAAFTKLFEKTKEKDDLVSALDSYESAFRLAHFIERTYESDEAGLFLNRIKHSAYSRPIDVCIKLFELTDENSYLEAAYVFDQRNKASVLQLNLRENELRIQATEPLLREEARLRSQLTRLALKATTTDDPAQVTKISSEARDLEIELREIQDEISKLPEYQDKFLIEEIPTVKEVQKRFDNRTALISWHLSENSLLALIIRGNKFTHKLIPVDSNFLDLLDAFRGEIEKADPVRKYEGRQYATVLHKLLFEPLVSDLHKAERLIIIPDDELSYLPFEALQDKDNHYVVAKYAVQYQFSTHFAARNFKHSRQTGILAFAPFAKKGFEDKQRDLSALPTSFEEIKDLDATILIDSMATKENFLRSANQYRILHLATHASVNDSVAGMSFIAFYPSTDDYKLYGREIYDLRLDSTELVILSACETGMGNLVKGEGLMSLSRAFAFAGCPNIIMSLWRAEDKTTSYLTKKLHEYLEEGYTKDVALQKAKNALLNDKNIDPRYKTPNYWAHLMFIGDYDKQKASRTWIWVVGVFIFLAVVYLVVTKVRKTNISRK